MSHVPQEKGIPTVSPLNKRTLILFMGKHFCYLVSSLCQAAPSVLYILNFLVNVMQRSKPNIQKNIKFKTEYVNELLSSKENKCASYETKQSPAIGFLAN